MLHSRLLKCSLACNLALGLFLLFVIDYSRAGGAGGVVERGGDSRISENVPPEALELSVNERSQAEPKSGTASAKDRKVVPDWTEVTFPLAPWRSFVFEGRQSQTLGLYTKRALKMTPEEVASIEGLAARLAATIEKLKESHVVATELELLKDRPPFVSIPESELDALCVEFSKAAVECLGPVRGRALADAVLLSRTFLTEPYASWQRSYRFRKWRDELRAKYPNESVGEGYSAGAIYIEYVPSEGANPSFRLNHRSKVDRAVFYDLK